VIARQDGPNIERIRSLGIRTALLPRLWKAKLFFIPRLLIETLFLGFICLREKVDLIHLNTGVASGLAGVFAAKLLGLPCVSHARGNETMFMGSLALRASRWVDAFLCVSSAVRLAYKLDAFKAKETVKTIYDGLDPEEFRLDPSVRVAQREALQLSESACAIGMVARFVEGKGHEPFLRAAREVVESCGDVTFFLVGANGSQNGSPYEHHIRQLVKTLSLEDKVRLINWQRDVKPVVAAMDIVALPSLGEGLPLALAEAMLLGKVVVATEVGGIPELVRDGEEGILVPPSSVPELAEAMKELVINLEKRQRMAQAGRHRILTDFSVERVAGEILGTYEQLLPLASREGGVP